MEDAGEGIATLSREAGEGGSRSLSAGCRVGVCSATRDYLMRGGAEVAEVLIADDEPAMLKSLSLLLKQRGLKVAAASNGWEVHSKLWRRGADGKPPYDALMLDIKMPDIDGWQVLRAMQANPLWKDIPVVVMSGYANAPADYANVMRLNGLLVEKKEDFARVVTAVLDRILAATNHHQAVTQLAGS